MIKLKDILQEVIQDLRISKKEEAYSFNFILNVALPQIITWWNKTYAKSNSSITDRFFDINDIRKNLKKSAVYKNRTSGSSSDSIEFLYLKDIDFAYWKKIKIQLYKTIGEPNKLAFYISVAIEPTAHFFFSKVFGVGERLDLP